MEKLINGELITKESLVEVHKGLVYKEANRLRVRALSLGIELEDLVSIGFMGLLKAFDRFDYEKFPVRFSTYAVPMIWGEMQRVIRDSDAGIKYTRSIKEIGWNIRRYELEELSVEDISLNLRVKPSSVVHALDFLKNSTPNRLDEPIHVSDGTKVMVSDTIGKSDDVTEIFVQEFMDTLDDREKEIVLGRMKEMSQTELGKRIGVSQVQISRMLTKIGKKYINYLNSGMEESYNREDLTRTREIKETYKSAPSDKEVKFTKEDVRRLRAEGLTYVEVAIELGVSLQTLTIRRNEWKSMDSVEEVGKEVNVESGTRELQEELKKSKDALLKQSKTISDQRMHIQELEEKCKSLESKIVVDLINKSGRELVLMLVEREKERNKNETI